MTALSYSWDEWIQIRISGKSKSYLDYFDHQEQGEWEGDHYEDQAEQGDQVGAHPGTRVTGWYKNEIQYRINNNQTIPL